MNEIKKILQVAHVPFKDLVVECFPLITKSIHRSLHFDLELMYGQQSLNARIDWTTSQASLTS